LLFKDESFAGHRAGEEAKQYLVSFGRCGGNNKNGDKLGFSIEEKVVK
jgi:hypothetical protein